MNRRNLWFRGWSGGKLLNWSFLKVYYGHGMMWFRLFDWGLHIKDMERNPLLYSQRNGRGRVMFKKWWIQVLKRGE
jgi:hypothetical protein